MSERKLIFKCVHGESFFCDAGIGVSVNHGEHLSMIRELSKAYESVRTKLADTEANVRKSNAESKKLWDAMKERDEAHQKIKSLQNHLAVANDIKNTLHKQLDVARRALREIADRIDNFTGGAGQLPFTVTCIDDITTKALEEIGDE